VKKGGKGGRKRNCSARTVNRPLGGPKTGRFHTRDCVRWGGGCPTGQAAGTQNICGVFRGGARVRELLRILRHFRARGGVPCFCFFRYVAGWRTPPQRFNGGPFVFGGRRGTGWGNFKPNGPNDVALLHDGGGRVKNRGAVRFLWDLPVGRTNFPKPTRANPRGGVRQFPGRIRLSSLGRFFGSTGPQPGPPA